MKWLKHETDSKSSEKMARLIDEFGFEGYGRFWRIMEIVADKMDETDRCHVEFPVKTWLSLLAIRRPLFDRYLVVICLLFDMKTITTGTDGLLLRIEIPNLLKKRDNYSKNLQVTNKKHGPKIKEVDIEIDKEKDKPSSPPSSEEDFKTAQFILDEKSKVHPTHEPPDLKKWANTVRLMREQDKRRHREIKEVYSWAMRDCFWSSICLSPLNLRKSWEKIIARMQNRGPAPPGNGFNRKPHTPLTPRL